jgi:ABC-2 type transport system ATP-binding protein
VLVTHFMEEAERLCDRIAVIDSGRIVALDTPAALASGADVGQRIKFRPDRPLDEAELLALPEVRSVQLRAGQVTATGTDAMLNAVTSLLARRGIAARQLRVDQASLEDAFMALTGRHHDEKSTPGQEKIDIR